METADCFEKLYKRHVERIMVGSQERNSQEYRKVLLKWLWRIATAAIITAAVFFIGDIIGEQWTIVKKGPETIVWGRLFAGLLIFEMYWVYQVFFMRHVMSNMGSKLSILQAFYMYFSSNLLAYIPGKVANFIGMAALAKRIKISRTHTVTTVMLLQVYSLVSGTFLIAIFRIVSDEKIGLLIPDKWIPILTLIAIAGITSVSPFILGPVFYALRRVTGREIRDINLTFLDHLVHVGRFSLSWLILGTAMWFIVSSFGIYPLGAVPMMSVTVVIIAGYLMGLLAVIVPAGFGVAELGFVYGFMKLYEPAQAVWGAASFRLTALVTTLISFLFVWSIDKYFKKNAVDTAVV
ncbi:MAG: lysylphosphatidylglycerol synthase domain-containing protein [bacterium]|nr:lysylphosphatidylglycerol synthase domain-containing protein [bacterium]